MAHHAYRHASLWGTLESQLINRKRVIVTMGRQGFGALGEPSVRKTVKSLLNYH
jgi:hypothetical protein